MPNTTESAAAGISATSAEAFMAMHKPKPKEDTLFDRLERLKKQKREKKIKSKGEGSYTSVLESSVNSIYDNPYWDPETPSPVYRDMLSLSRKVVREEKKLDKLLVQKKKVIESRLERRLVKVLEVTTEEDRRLRQIAAGTEAAAQFELEVDSQMEDASVERATRLYSKLRIDKQLPRWCKTVNQAIDHCKAYGHANKLRWRSTILELLQKALVETEEDTSSEESRFELRQIILSINTMLANELVRVLKELIDTYIYEYSSLDESSKLGHDTKILLEVEEKMLARARKPVPVPREDWSAKLQELDMTRRSLAVHSVDTLPSFSQVLADDSMVTNPRLMNTTVGGSTTMMIDGGEGGGVGGGGGGTTTSGKKTDAGTRPHTPLDDPSRPPLVRMRVAAIRGDFPTTLSIFKQTHTPPPHNVPPQLTNTPAKQAMIPGKLQVTSLVPFRILMTAFKNTPGADINYEYAYRTMDLIESYGLMPDLTIYNIMMSPCIRQSRWRRCLQIMQDMTRLHSISPSSQSFSILLDCCRHSIELPSVIYAQLRVCDYPEVREYDIRLNKQ